MDMYSNKKVWAHNLKTPTPYKKESPKPLVAGLL